MRNRERVLDWLARVRVAGAEPLGVALGISEGRIREHARRLEADGLVLRSRMDDGDGAVLAVTPRGIRAAGYAANSRTPTSSRTGLEHGRGVSWIAAHCERSGRLWLGPAELRADGWPMSLPARSKPGAATHMPDLGFVVDGQERWAAEFERMPKSRERLERILEGYRELQIREELEAVLYVCATEYIARLVESVAMDVEVDRAVRTLDRIIDETRGQIPAAA